MAADTQTEESVIENQSVDWEPEILAIEQEDGRRPIPNGGIVFVGSSTFRLWEFMESDFAPLPIVNRGFGGSMIGDAVRHAQRLILQYEPRQVVVYSGENDIGAGRMPREIFHDYHRLVDLIHASQPRTLVTYVSIKQSPERWPLRDAIRVTNHLIAAYTKDHPGTSFVDITSLTLDQNGKPDPKFYTDGIHLSREGYEAWIPLLRAALID